MPSNNRSLSPAYDKSDHIFGGNVPEAEPRYNSRPQTASGLPRMQQNTNHNNGNSTFQFPGASTMNSRPSTAGGPMVSRSLPYLGPGLGAFHLGPTSTQYSNNSTFAAQKFLQQSGAGGSTGNLLSAESTIKLPRYVETDKQICRFFGYVEVNRTWDRDGPLGLSTIEPTMRRDMTFLYYIYDDTLEITEGREVNSGLPQGAYLKRSSVNKADGSPVTLTDLEPGKLLEVIGQRFHITDADVFTRDYFRRELNIILPPALSRPPRPEQDLGAQFATGLGPSLASQKNSGNFNTRSTGYLATKEALDKTHRFLQFEGHVLRFLCVEVSNPSPPYFPDLEDELADKGHSLYQLSNGYGFIASNSAKKYALSFYLANDAVDLVVQRKPAGSGERDGAGYDEPRLVLKKSKLPKNWRDVQRGRAPVNYGAMDFRCGMIVDIYGRYFLLVDCDSYTQDYFRNRNVKQSPVTLVHEEIERIVQPIPLLGDGFLPIGSAEDTLATVYGMPKVRKDVLKISKNQGRLIRCKAVLLTNNVVDASREFMITFFLEDDTIQVFEDVRRNSGIGGGNFLKRGRYMNELPHDTEDSNDPRHFQATDIYLGNVIALNGCQFQIIDMDNMSLKFCESYPDEFPMSDTFLIVGNMMLQVAELQLDLRPVFVAADKVGSGFLDQETYVVTLDSLGLCEQLNDQELLTLIRRFKDGDVFYYHEMCDLMSHLYFQHRSLAQHPPSHVNSLDALTIVARMRTVQWRRMFRKDLHTLHGKITLAILVKLFEKNGVPISPHVAMELYRDYHVAQKIARPVLEELQRKNLTEEYYDGLDVKIQKKNANKRRDSKIRTHLLYTPAMTRKIEDLRRARASATSVLRSPMSRASISTEPSQDGGNKMNYAEVLIDYNKLCDDIYVADWI